MKSDNFKLNPYAKEFIPSEKYNNIKLQKTFAKQKSSLEITKDKAKEIKKKYTGLEVDKRRTFSKKQADEIWKLANTDYRFDSNLFRLDLFNCLVCKTVKYNNTSGPVRKFAYDLEHVVSYSDNGMTEIGNGALLNSGSNRSKGNKACYKINENEYAGMKIRFGIDASSLYYDLENNLEETCKKYNLLFRKKDNIWTLSKQNNKLDNYNGEYKNFPAKLDGNIDNAVEAAVLIGGFSAMFYVADSLLDYSIVGYNTLYYKIKKSIGFKVEENPDTNLTKSQEMLKHVLASGITLCATIAIVNKVKQKK